MKEFNQDHQEIVEILNALRTCIDRRHYTLYKKIIGGIGCDTIENVKLSMIAYLLIKYQKNKETCLDNPSSRTGWKIVNVFVDFVTRECRDCLKQYPFAEPVGVSTIGNGPSNNLPPTYYLLTSDGNTLVTQSGDYLNQQA